jgi:hypothetical protein
VPPDRHRDGVRSLRARAPRGALRTTRARRRRASANRRRRATTSSWARCTAASRATRADARDGSRS